MIRYAAVPLLAILAACSAEVENGEAAEANVIDTLSVNNLVVTNSNSATAVREMETQSPPPAQPAHTAAPVADKRDGRSTAAEPKQQTIRKPSTEAAASQHLSRRPSRQRTPRQNQRRGLAHARLSTGRWAIADRQLGPLNC
ncbi:MAG: hypothetical protein ACR2JJ_08135 [Sphingomicrobium sp.]